VVDVLPNLSSELLEKINRLYDAFIEPSGDEICSHQPISD
jgi:hypothetical protein